MAYIGPEPNPGQNREVDDISSSFNGSTTAFTLQVNSQNVSPGSSNAIIVSLGGVVQNPGTDYTIASSTITFTTAPASGLSFFGLVLGQGVDTGVPSDGSVTLAKFVNGTSSNNGKFLRANNGAAPSFETVSAGTSLSGSTDNTVCTVTGANAIQGEANLTFDGLRLGINRTPTANADYPLQIKSANATAFAHFRSSQSAGDDPNTDGGLVGILNDDMYLWGRESGSRIILGTNNSEKVRITDAGNVGIGITNPNTDLVVQNTDDVDYNISTAVTNPAITIKLNSGATGNDKCVGLSFNGPNANGEGFITMVGHSSTEASMHFGMRSGGSRADKVIFESGGRVRMPGVYSTAGSSMRDVQIESDGTLCGLSSITAAKTNITDLTDVSWLYNLKPKTFNFRKKTSDIVTGENTYLDEAETEKAYGLLAEDVETVNKDFCFYDKDSEGNDVLAGVYYKTMVVPLLKAVQELKAENTALTTRVAALEAA